MTGSGGRTAIRRATSAGLLVIVLLHGATAAAQQLIVGGMSWMTGFPSTWNAGAPKMVSDGLFYYAAICGVNGSPSTCTLARRRGLEDWSTTGHRVFTSNQPATLVIDRKGRLNVFFNDPLLRHYRFDHPAVNLTDWTSVPFPFTEDVGYIHAAYDAADDSLMLAFNETATWGLKFAIKYTDANAWMVAPLPDASAGTMLLYARALRTPGRYVVLAGEHVTGGSNASYTAAIMFESATPSGPWNRRVLHQVYGSNLGIPYQNWVLANDVQADALGRVRALLHITEAQSGHADALDGLYILREEDGYLPRLIAAASTGLEDGFTLYADPGGVHMAFARSQVPHYYPGTTTNPYMYTGDIVSYRSTDGGATWTSQLSEVESAVNPSQVEPRNGSMLGGAFVPFVFSDENTTEHSYDSVWYLGALLYIPHTANRYDYGFPGGDGASFYVRAYEETSTGRYYYYLYDYAPDGSFAITYSYRAGAYCQAYIADSSGAYRHYNSDGFQAAVGTPAVVRYEVNNGEHTIHLRGLCGEPTRITGLKVKQPGH